VLLEGEDVNCQLQTRISYLSIFSSDDEEDELLNLIAEQWGRFLVQCPPGEQSLIEHLQNAELLENTTQENAESVILWLEVRFSSFHIR
jgi:hypothetical protein